MTNNNQSIDHEPLNYRTGITILYAETSLIAGGAALSTLELSPGSGLIVLGLGSVAIGLTGKLLESLCSPH
ncbi:MAG: hypothetical protein AAB459_00760 [Patescibacteria group bacterium]